MYRTATFVFIGILIGSLIIWGCSSSTDSNDTGIEDDWAGRLAFEDSLDQVQATAYDQFEVLLNDLDTTFAIDSLATLLASDAIITSAEAFSLGIWIRYYNDMRGVILMKWGNYDIGQPSQMKVKTSNSGDRFSAGSPTSPKCLYLDVIYSERRPQSNQAIIEAVDEALSSVNYDNLTIFKDDQCTVDRFYDMSGYGVVRIHSHGIPNPSESSIQEIFCVTGESRNPITSTKYKAQRIAQTLLLATPPEGGTARYMVCDDFVRESPRNRFEAEKTLFFLGFCYSSLGDWPKSLVDTSTPCRASACVAYEWTAPFESDSLWAVDFFVEMCNAGSEVPLTVSDWFSTHEAAYYTVYIPRNNKWMNIIKDGDGNTTLWKSEGPEQIVADGSDPSISPDGEWLVYEGPDVTVKKCRIDGSEASILANGWEPDWSSYHNLIIFDDDSSSSLIVYDPSDGSTEILLQECDCDGAVWSPLGDEIVAQYEGAGGDNLLFISYPDGETSTSPCSDPLDGDCEGEVPTWSPDGEYIAFEDGLQIMKVARDGGTAEVVVNTGKDVSYPSWSPDGKWIAFMMSDVSGEYAHIWVVDARGQSYGLHQVTSGSFADMSMCWSPESDYIYFSRYQVTGPMEETPLGIWRIEFTLE